MYLSHLLLQEMALAPSSEWNPPMACWCCARIEQGQGYWLGRGEPRELAAGDVTLVAPDTSGLFRASQLGTLRLSYFRFCPELSASVLSVAERNYFDHLAGQPQHAIRIFHPDHPVAVRFAELSARSQTENGLLQRCAMLQLLGTIFARELSRTRPSEQSRPTLSASKRIRVLMHHLTEEEFLRASTEELAAYCGCSLRHFSRLFLQAFGISLRARQTELRLMKAQRLLAETHSRVVTVATRCGYRHLGVFNALFKKRVGMTPTEWRHHINECKDNTVLCTSPTQRSPTRPPVGRKAQDSNGPGVTET
jgi:AraC-like DNA-binding protein